MPKCERFARDANGWQQSITQNETLSNAWTELKLIAPVDRWSQSGALGGISWDQEKQALQPIWPSHLIAWPRLSNHGKVTQMTVYVRAFNQCKGVYRRRYHSYLPDNETEHKANKSFNISMHRLQNVQFALLYGLHRPCQQTYSGYLDLITAAHWARLCVCVCVRALLETIGNA